MTASARIAISALPKGHEFQPTGFELSAAEVAAYLDAVGDANDYQGIVPPLAAVALGLAALQQQIALPEGALHAGQEVDHLASVHAGQLLTLTGRVAQRSERQGMVVSVLEFEIAAAGAFAIRARTTILAPGSAS
jgi:hypothetical protein